MSSSTLVTTAGATGATALSEIGASDRETYTFKFPKSGVYNYVCVIHAPQGMFGTITVAEAGPPALLPVAGADRPSPLLPLLIGSAIVLILLGLLIRWRWAGR